MNILPFVVDGIIILIFAACIFDGYRRGFVKMLLSLAAIVISVAVASALSAPVAKWAYDEYVGDIASEYVESYFESALESAGLTEDEFTGSNFEGSKEKIAEAIPEEIAEFLEEYDISIEEILDGVSAEDTLEETGEKIIENVERAIILPVLEITAFILIYIVSSIILTIVVGVICSLFKLPIIKGINKSFGAALGTLKGLAVIGVLSVFAVFAASFLSGNELADAVSEATLTNAISEIVLQLIG